MIKNHFIFIFLLSLTTSVFAEGVIFIGDTGRRNASQALVAKAMSAFCKKEKCQMGILLGDNVYPGGVVSENDSVLEEAFDFYYNPLKIPFLITMGNHDYGNKSNIWIRGNYQLAHGKKNPLFYLPSFWYTYETDNTLIAVIDTARMMWRKDILPQAKMIEEAYALAKSKNKWFIVAGHHPYLSNGHHGNAGSYDGIRSLKFLSGIYIKNFVEKYICEKANFYLSGHDHSLQVIDGNIAGCNTQFIISGAGSAIDSFHGNNKLEFGALKLGFMQLNFASASAELKVIDENSETIFEKSYKKK
ncbi:MAG: metallophosphoesterase [Bacteriovoracaceae bacterium]